MHFNMTALGLVSPIKSFTFHDEESLVARSLCSLWKRSVKQTIFETHSSPEGVLAPRTNIAELPISPFTSLETSRPSSTSLSLLSSNSSSASSTVLFSVTPIALQTCASKAVEIGFSAIYDYL